MTATLQIRKKVEASNPRLEFERKMGLEPTTLPGTARHIVPEAERVGGQVCTVRYIIPTLAPYASAVCSFGSAVYLAWEASVLPLNYTRLHWKRMLDSSLILA